MAARCFVSGDDLVGLAERLREPLKFILWNACH
jgi:hypothetical protein